MSEFGDLRAEWAAKLVAAGVGGATTDPVANVPFVLVDAISGPGVGQGVGAWVGLLPIRIVVAPPGDAAALAALEDSLEAVLRLFGPAPFAATTYGPSDLPSYTVTYPVSIPNPDC